MVLLYDTMEYRELTQGTIPFASIGSRISH